MPNLQPTSNPIPDLIRSAGEKSHLALTEKQLDDIGTFCQMLGQYNEHTNLVSDAEISVVARDHVLDSFSLVPIIEKSRRESSTGNRLIDIGSGAGFPGLILALSVCGLSVTLVEAVGKKARFLEDVVDKLQLKQLVEVKTARAEELAHHQQYRGQFAFATARAIGSFATVCELTAPFLAPYGLALIQKSVKQWHLDLPLAPDNVAKVGAHLKETIVLDREISGKDLAVVVLEQARPAKAKYPRQWAQIKKSPLF